MDLDNNGSGPPFTDIMSGIVTLSLDGEPLDDGDPFNCYFDYDASGNNTVDFGFFNPDITSVNNTNAGNDNWIQISPNPAHNELTIKGELSLDQIEIYDSVGRLYHTINASNKTHTIDVASLPKGLYVVKILSKGNNNIEVHKIIKQ